MNIALVTNLRAPYRTLQLNEFSKIKDVTLTVYYTDKPNKNRGWNTNKAIGYKEVDLKGYKLFEKFGCLNKGLIEIVKSHDLLILGGYEKPTYIVLSILCKILNKPFILLFDGISTYRLNKKESFLKRFIKSIVIKNASFIMGNGDVSKQYFSELFSYPIERIYNQYLTVDTKRIGVLYKDREKYRRIYREKLGIKQNDKVLIYSGRLIDIKNVRIVIDAIAKLEKENLVFLIIGGGILEDELKRYAEKLKVNMIITGFIPDQEEVFKHYFVGDAVILPSIVEPWGLVINEALAAGLPVIVSKHCGCANDLVLHGENGYLINPFDVNEISKYIENVIYIDDKEKFSKKSKEIISEWTFENSRKSLEKILINIKNKE